MIYIRINPSANRLGNWLFQFAAARKEFPNEEISFVIEAGQDVASVRKYSSSLRMGVSYVSEASHDAFVREGLYQGARLVDRAQCRMLYQCPTEVRDRIRERYGLLLSNEKLVSIHVRRGDYLNLPHRHPFVGKGYLRAAVAEFPQAEFLVCSDDILWCRRYFKGPRFHFAEGNDVLTDLFLLSMCRGGHICSNSTFSWWGAFLGDDLVRTIFPWRARISSATAPIFALARDGCLSGLQLGG